MIAKKYRLREYEIGRVFKKGRPFFGSFWSVNVLASRNAHHRMAVSISTKHDKRAVQRNRYRRAVYDYLLPSLNDQPSTINHQPKYLCIFILKKGLKLTEKNIPTLWLDDAKRLLEKATTSSQGGAQYGTRPMRPFVPRPPR